MKLSKWEQETIISFNEEEQTASVYTHNKPLRRKLDALAVERPMDCRLVRESRGGMAGDYIVPKSWVRISPPKKHTFSEEQLATMRERMLKINSERR